MKDLLKKRMGLALMSTLTFSSCAYFASYHVYSDLYRQIGELEIKDHEGMKKYMTYIPVLPYLICDGGHVPLPLPVVTKEHAATIYGREGIRVMCPFDAMGQEARKRKMIHLHQYYIVENNQVEGGFADWGKLSGAKVLESGKMATLNELRYGVITSCKENNICGSFIFKEGLIPRNSPFILILAEKTIEGTFGKKEVAVYEKGSSRKWMPFNEHEFNKISELIPSEFRKVD